MPGDERRLVYSTDGSLPLPKPAAQRPRPRRRAESLPDDGVVRVGFERRRSGGVTLIHGLEERELATTAKDLKRRCGTGGTAKDGVVELQGDHRATILAFFSERGRKVKRMGG